MTRRAKPFAGFVSHQSLPPLRQLTTVSRALGYANSLDAVLDIVEHSAVELLSADRLMLFLADSVADSVAARAGASYDTETGVAGADAGTVYRPRVSVGLKTPAAAHALEPHDVEDELYRCLGDNPLSIPLLSGVRLMGVLGVAWERQAGGSADDQSRWTLAAFGDQLAVAIDGLEREQFLHQRTQALAQTEQRERGHKIALDSLTHDVRSPLNSISMQLQLLDKEILGPLTAEQKDVLQRIDSGVRSIADLATEVIETGRLLATEEVPELVSVAAAGAVDEARRRLDPQRLAKSITVVSHVHDAISVAAQPQWLARILNNLLDNAIKYTPQNGSIDVAAREEGGVVLLSVTDNGPGVPADAHASLFEPYIRASNSAMGVQGVGLGLSLARTLARRMEGSLSLDPGVTNGARFVLQLSSATRRTRESDG